LHTSGVTSFAPFSRNGKYAPPLGELFDKGLRIGMGQSPVKRYDEFLPNLSNAERAKPSAFINQRLALTAACSAFDTRDSGYTKVALKPGLAS
jgi:glutathione-independent formaldehyde dehydrogenase